MEEAMRTTPEKKTVETAFRFWWRSFVATMDASRIIEASFDAGYMLGASTSDGKVQAMCRYCTQPAVQALDEYYPWYCDDCRALKDGEEALDRARDCREDEDPATAN